MPRYMAIDYGSKRLGLAVSDAGATLASPLTTLPSTGRMADDVANVLAEAREFEVDEFVVGLPLNMDGTEGPQAKATRRFGDELAKTSGRPVHYFDERLSSVTAEGLLQPGEFTRKKKKNRMDRVAAQVILLAFLESAGDSKNQEPKG